MQSGLDPILEDIARRYGTPCYVYLWPEIERRIERLRKAFPDAVSISYAFKANPNAKLLERLASRVDLGDVSSVGEVERGLEAGFAPERLTFSGPAKREEELRRSVEIPLGAVVCESPWELERLNALAAEAGRRLPILIRLNPATVLRGFGVQMSGRASQFGIDEEDADPVLERLEEWSHLRFDGFHVYAATNSLDPEAIARSFATSSQLFAKLAEQHDLRPQRLIYGAGFGIPYTQEETPLELDRTAGLLREELAAVRRDPRLGGAECILELGRYLVGPAGYFLTRVVNEKRSRGVAIRMCDGGLNAHLAAFGLLGTVIRRNWPIHRVGAGEDGPGREYMLTGPLCTSIDVLAPRIRLPVLHRGDLLAVASSGAYGFTSSPTRFISHPEPTELLVLDRSGLKVLEAG